MKKLFAVTLIVLFISVFAFSQTETPKTPDWQLFAPDGEDFLIEVPIPLDASNFQNVDPKNISRRYVNSLNGTYFYIFTDDSKKPIQFDFVSAFADSNQKGVTVDISGKLEIKKFVFADKEDFYHTIFAYKGENRFYIFQTISPTKENPIAERFLGSIKFILDSTTKSNAEITKEKETVIDIPFSNVPIPIKIPENGNNSGNGLESGQGIKKIPQTNPQMPTTKITAGVQILSKPKALFTDFARFFQMSGKVTLRVVFSANGTIGTITPMKKLPFGLTEQAIIAARGMKFEPAIRDGVAYSVIKPVEYTFTIY